MDNQLPKTGLVRLGTVLKTLDISRSTWYRGIQKGFFPKPVKFGDRCARWRAEDILVLMEPESHHLDRIGTTVPPSANESR